VGASARATHQRRGCADGGQARAAAPSQGTLLALRKIFKDTRHDRGQGRPETGACCLRLAAEPACCLRLAAEPPATRTPRGLRLAATGSAHIRRGLRLAAAARTSTPRGLRLAATGGASIRRGFRLAVAARMGPRGTRDGPCHHRLAAVGNAARARP